MSKEVAVLADNQWREIDAISDSHREVRVLWRKDNGIDKVALSVIPHNGDQSATFEIEPSEIRDAEQHPYIYSERALGHLAAASALGLGRVENEYSEAAAA